MSHLTVHVHVYGVARVTRKTLQRQVKEHSLQSAWRCSGLTPHDSHHGFCMKRSTGKEMGLRDFWQNMVPLFLQWTWS